MSPTRRLSPSVNSCPSSPSPSLPIVVVSRGSKESPRPRSAALDSRPLIRFSSSLHSSSSISSSSSPAASPSKAPAQPLTLPKHRRNLASIDAPFVIESSPSRPAPPETIVVISSLNSERQNVVESVENVESHQNVENIENVESGSSNNSVSVSSLQRSRKPEPLNQALFELLPMPQPLSRSAIQSPEEISKTLDQQLPDTPSIKTLARQDAQFSHLKVMVESMFVQAIAAIHHFTETPPMTPTHTDQTSAMRPSTAASTTVSTPVRPSIINDVEYWSRFFNKNLDGCSSVRWINYWTQREERQREVSSLTLPSMSVPHGELSRFQFSPHLVHLRPTVDRRRQSQDAE